MRACLGRTGVLFISRALTDGWRCAAVAFVGLCFMAATTVLINPLGYFGGNWDDGRYIEAALDWARSGPQLGANHWALRWPVVLPAALLVPDRAALMVPPLLAYAALIGFNFWAARRFFGTTAAVVACAALITTPEIALWATRINPDIPELLFWSIALWSLALGGEGQRGWLVLSGVAAGLAWATRETSAGLLLLMAIAFLTGTGPPRTAYVWIAAGFTAVALPEMVILWNASGDPLYRLHVDLNHIRIASNDIAGKIVNGQDAPLNPNVMQRWSGGGPLRGHWLIDPWANLFLNVKLGLDFVLAMLALVVIRLLKPETNWRPARILIVVALCNIITVLYIAAADPKPRMFMPATLSMCLIFGWAVARVPLQRVRVAVISVLAIKLIATLILVDLKASFARAHDVATVAHQSVGEPVYMDRWTISHLDLAPPALLNRLHHGVAPVGGLQMTVAQIGDNDRSDEDIPPRGFRWQLLRRFPTGQSPLTVRWLYPLAGQIGLMQNFQYKDVAVTLYRRLPDPVEPKK